MKMNANEFLKQLREAEARARNDVNLMHFASIMVIILAFVNMFVGFIPLILFFILIFINTVNCSYQTGKIVERFKNWEPVCDQDPCFWDDTQKTRKTTTGEKR